jgi:sulfite reductase (NADPH) flavoprotein alpha-component
MSTTGLGDPALDAEDFVEALNSEQAPRLENLRFGVLALGDKVYPDFCAPGKALDARLEALGAARVVDLHTCDVDYEVEATRWLRGAGDRFDDLVESGGEDADGAAADVFADVPASDRASRRHVFHPAILEAVRILSDADREREITHYTLALPEDLQEQWQAGDSVDVLLPNDPELVTAILDHLRIDPATEVAELGLGIEEVLRTQLELRDLPLTLLENFAGSDPSGELAGLLADEDSVEGAARLAQWRYGRDLLAVLHAVPGARPSAEELVALLRPLQPRSYSIASSPVVDRRVVDLTVRTIRYDLDGRELEGTASGALAQRVRVGEQVPVRLRPAPAFHLPEDPSADVVMVGPGVGIAPFRGFLQEREVRGDTGRSWLLCGVRDPEQDGLYLEEFIALRERGVLTELDVAASRVADAEVQGKYVQHVIERRGEEIIGWLQDGAVFYVCGDAAAMAPAVRAAIRGAAAEGLGGEAAAAAFLAELDAERRYRQDVY